MLCEVYSYVCDVIDDRYEWLSISYLFSTKLYAQHKYSIHVGIKVKVDAKDILQLPRPTQH